jgi:hypothetical protein
MTSRYLTLSEATELLETGFLTTPEIDGSVVSEVVAGVNCHEATRVIESYLSLMAGQIDPDSFTVKADTLDDAPDLDAVIITIKTREWE